MTSCIVDQFKVVDVAHDNTELEILIPGDIIVYGIDIFYESIIILDAGQIIASGMELSGLKIFLLTLLLLIFIFDILEAAEHVFAV